MYRIILGVVSLLIVAGLNWSVYVKETLIANGETVYFELAPVDPRSLMQGDYMRLDYAVARNARPSRVDGSVAKRGSLVVRLDRRNVATFERFHEGEALAANERLIRYRRARRSQIEIAPDAFFFQEGHAAHYVSARYGVFRYGAVDERVLIGLAGEDLVTIVPPDDGEPSARP